MTQEVEFDRQMLGKRIIVDTVKFDEVTVGHYLAAIGETELPADEEGPIVPPLMGMAFVGELPQVRMSWGTRGFLASQVFYPLVPLRQGDSISTTSTLKDVYQKTGRSGRLVFLVWDTELTNQRGEVVAICRRSFARQE